LAQSSTLKLTTSRTLETILLIGCAIDIASAAWIASSMRRCEPGVVSTAAFIAPDPAAKSYDASLLSIPFLHAAKLGAKKEGGSELLLPPSLNC
jgi:hypothetical protein